MQNFALRSVSLLAGIGTLYVWYRIGYEFLDREFGLTLAGLYVVLPQVSGQIPNARPYSLALLAEISGLLFFLRWLRSRRRRDALLWTVCASVSVHFHIFFGLGLAIEIAFAFAREIWWKFANFGQLVTGIGLSIMLLLPALPQVLMLLGERKLLVYSEVPDYVTLTFQVIPAAFVPIILTVIIIAFTEKRMPKLKTGDAFALICALLLIPTLGIFALSHLSTIALFKARYLLPAAPGLVFLWSWFLRSIESQRGRRMLTIVAILATATGTSGRSLFPQYNKDDWRSAVEAAPESTPIVLYAGLVETRKLDWLRDPARWPYLIAPARAYRSGLRPQDTLLVPFEFEQRTQEYMERLTPDFLRGRNGVCLLISEYPQGKRWIGWFRNRLSKNGFREVRSSNSGCIWTLSFQK